MQFLKSLNKSIICLFPSFQKLSSDFIEKNFKFAEIKKKIKESLFPVFDSIKGIINRKPAKIESNIYNEMIEGVDTLIIGEWDKMINNEYNNIDKNETYINKKLENIKEIVKNEEIEVSGLYTRVKENISKINNGFIVRDGELFNYFSKVKPIFK